MKFLYVLVSDVNDIYYETTLISIMSLRHHNPDAHVAILVDDNTDKNLKGFRAKIREFVNEYKVVPFKGDTSNMVRSRYLKTNMRNLIEGDFLFIDGDTAVVDRLDPVPINTQDSIYAVTDLHSGTNDKYHMKHKRMTAHKKAMDFSLSLGEKYFNSGVIYARDDEPAHRFFSKWHDLYCQCAEKKIFTDQISFNEVNHLMGRPIQEWSGEWNCQVREAYNHLTRVKDIYPILCRSKIIHFFSSGIDGKKEPHPLMKREFFENIKKKQCIDQESLDIIYSAKRYFWGAPEKMDEKDAFPKFFMYRQFPHFCKFLRQLNII